MVKFNYLKYALYLYCFNFSTNNFLSLALYCLYILPLPFFPTSFNKNVLDFNSVRVIFHCPSVGTFYLQFLPHPYLKWKKLQIVKFNFCTMCFNRFLETAYNNASAITETYRIPHYINIFNVQPIYSLSLLPPQTPWQVQVFFFLFLFQEFSLLQNII